MKILCKLFGHQSPVYAKPGWWSPGEQYGVIKGGYVDGVGRIHGRVEAECARCEENFVVALVHIPRLDENGDEIKSD